MSKEIDPSEWLQNSASEGKKLLDAFREQAASAWEIYNFRSLSSTMDAANLLSDVVGREDLEKRFSPLVLRGIAEPWTAVFADTQTAGRGREGRQWSSQAGDGIYVSYLPNSRRERLEIGGLSLAVALAIVRVLARIGIEAKHKWPNDVFARTEAGEWKKIAGILVDAAFSENRLRALVIGLGLNVRTPSLDEAVGIDALRRESVSAPALAADLSGEVRELSEAFFETGFSPYVGEWENTSLTLGQDVSISTHGAELLGRVTGIAKDGALILNVEGEEHKIYSGTLRFRDDL